MNDRINDILKSNIWLTQGSNINAEYVKVGDKDVLMYIWECENPKGIVQIMHGMSEHAGRYDHFARYLNGFGLTVVAIDQRAHGYTDIDTLGYGEGDIWENTIVDQIFISKMMKRKYNLPLVLLGHSYGSFITQRLVELDKFADAFILTGSNYMKGFETIAGRLLSAIEMKRRGDDSKCYPLYNMSFKKYAKVFKNDGSWISRDEDISRKYREDKLSGFCCSSAFYYYFLVGVYKVYDKENLTSVDIKKPILLVSGTRDAVSNMGKGVKKLYNMYKKLGVIDLELKFYDNARHEVLNETNRDEVYEYILSFILRVINK